MITVEVVSADGWQNGKTLWETGKILDLECGQDRLQAHIDAGTIKVVTPERPDPDNDPVVLKQKEQQSIVDLTTKTVLAAMKEFNPSVVTVRDRNEDDPNFGFKSLGDFASEIYRGGPKGNTKRMREYDARMKTTGHMAEGDDAQGGHLVPVGFRASLLQTSLEATIVRQRAMFIPMQTNQVGVPAVRDYTHASGNQLYTSLILHRPGEGVQKTASKPQFDKVTLTLHKGVYLTYVSEELMEDSPISIEPLLNSMFSAGMGWHEDNDFINGTGVNMPLGILNSPALITFARQPASGYLSYLDLCTMWSRLHPASMPNSVWLISPSMIPYVYTACITCKGSDGSDLTGHPVMLPSAGASGSPYNTIFGRPVIVTEHCQVAGTSGDIYLADFSQYLVGGKANSAAPKLDSSIHLKFDYDEVAFRAVHRYDGAPWWQSTLTPKFGTATLSPFIALDDKS